jgi:hypothetical protein
VKRCGDCTHWTPCAEDDVEVGRWIGGHLTGVCDRFTPAQSSEPYPMAVLASDGSEAGPWLITSPDFGCAGFERRLRDVPTAVRATWTMRPDQHGKTKT